MADSAPQGRHVLFIDDDELIVRLTTVTLSRAGLRVSSFCDPHAALAAFSAAPDAFDLVVSDIELGSLSGLELSARMLAIRPNAPIVLTSGLILQEDRDRALGAGVRAVLPKAQVMTDLPGVVARLLR